MTDPDGMLALVAQARMEAPLDAFEADVARRIGASRQAARSAAAVAGALAAVLALGVGSGVAPSAPMRAEAAVPFSSPLAFAPSTLLSGG